MAMVWFQRNSPATMAEVTPPQIHFEVDERATRGDSGASMAGKVLAKSISGAGNFQINFQG